jgi:thioredoxin reductase
MTDGPIYDTVIVGGGPAGATAAVEKQHRTTAFGEA